MPILDFSALTQFQSQHRPLVGLDVGTKTVGVAMSDRLWTIATPSHTIRRTKFQADAKLLWNFMQEYAVAGLVVGWPLNMDGSEGPRCQSVRQFALNFLKIYDVPIVFFDERLSTVFATNAMLEADLSRARRDQLVDKLAASYILQGALDRVRNLVPPA